MCVYCRHTGQYIRAYHMAYVRDEDEQDTDPHTRIHTAPHTTQPTDDAAQGGTTAQPMDTDTETPAHTTTGFATHTVNTAAATTHTKTEVPRITFLYKLQEGAADQSFGLNVAQVRVCVRLLLYVYTWVRALRAITSECVYVCVFYTVPEVTVSEVYTGLKCLL